MDVSAGVFRGDSFAEDLGDGVEKLGGLLVLREGAAVCIKIRIDRDLRVAVDFEEDRAVGVGGPQIGVDVVSGGPDAERLVLDWATVFSVDDADVDFDGLRVGDAGHDEERAEQSEAGESAAFVLDAGYEGVEHVVLPHEQQIAMVCSAITGSRANDRFRSFSIMKWSNW